jgi:DNA polymerase-3 subunit beta
MKFIVSSSSLLGNLQKISGVLNANNTLPILDNFLFQIKENELTASASDLESTMITSINLDKSESDGLVAVPAKLLIDILKTFPEQPLSFTIDDKNFGIEISSDTGKYKLSGFYGEEFPKLPEIKGAAKFEIEAGNIFNAISKSLFASGNDELRPVMSGVLFELNNDDVTFVATDAHKLVRYRRTDVKTSSGGSFIMPKKPLQLLKTLSSGSNDNVEVEYSEVNASFRIDDVHLICRLIDGTYPNYEAVIPKENNSTLTIDRVSFLTSIRRVSIFSNKTTYQVRLKIAGSELNISAEDPDFSNEATERLTCHYEGDDIVIGFNSRFLIEMLNNLDSQNVMLKLSEPNRAGLLMPENQEDGEDVLMLVMPVMLNY